MQAGCECKMKPGPYHIFRNIILKCIILTPHLEFIYPPSKPFIFIFVIVWI